jgi:hypothetical protein
VLRCLWLPCGAVAAVREEDERRHRRGTDPLWGESWYFDFAAADASVGGFVRLGLYPNLGVAWYWAALVGQGRRLVLVRDHGIELPRGAALEVRGQGLWSSVTCETPLDHWSIGLEAFAVALDDPLEAFRGERGDLVGLGFDLEWEATGSAFPLGPACYGQASRVTGEILVGDEQLDFDGIGDRGHAWGVQDWWGAPRCRLSGVLDDGTTFAAVTGEDRTFGYPDAAQIEATTDPEGLLQAATVSLGELTITATALAHAPLLLEAPDGRVARLARALCLYRSGDGCPGVGWAEWLKPG